MTMWHVTMVLAVGATMLLAAVGFNRPSWSRTYTTAWRFWWMAAANIGLYLLALMLIYGALVRLTSDEWVKDEGPRTLLLWLALLIVACLRAFAPVSWRLRDAMHRLAGIPMQAQGLARLLADAPLVADATTLAQAKDMLRMRGIDTDEVWLPVAQPLHQQMLKATELFIRLRDWDHKPQMEKYTREVAHEFYRLRQRFDRLSFRVSRTLASIEQLGEIKVVVGSHGVTGCEELDQRMRQLISDMIADVCEDISLFYRDACVLAARGVMTKYWRRGARAAAIERMGFTVRISERSSLVQVFAYAALLLLAGLWVFFIVLPPNDGGGLGPVQRVCVILVIVMSTLAIAILPKFYFGFASGGLRRRTPAGFIAGAAVAALCAAVLINLVAGALLYGGIGGAVRRVTEAIPYLPSSFLTAASVAWLAQDHRWAMIEGSMARRLCDAAVFGLTWMAASVVARWIDADAPGELANWTTLKWAGAGMVFGALMGALVPEMVRKPREPLLAGDANPVVGYSPISPLDPGLLASAWPHRKSIPVERTAPEMVA